MDKQLLRFIQMSLQTICSTAERARVNATTDGRDDRYSSPTQVKRYESGQAQPSIEILKKIALAFHTTTDWLVFEEAATRAT